MSDVVALSDCLACGGRQVVKYFLQASKKKKLFACLRTLKL
jgi:hypothetical protein